MEGNLESLYLNGWKLGTRYGSQNNLKHHIKCLICVCMHGLNTCRCNSDEDVA